jgi:hypothetical protein
MSDDFNPLELVEYAESVAHQMITGMPEEEAVAMVRDFIGVLSEWQPSVAEHRDDPTLLAITALSTTRLFELAFIKAYSFSAKQIAAREAIAKALGNQS